MDWLQAQRKWGAFAVAENIQVVEGGDWYHRRRSAVSAGSNGLLGSGAAVHAGDGVDYGKAE